MKTYRIEYVLYPEAENIEIIVFAKNYEEACAYAKEYRKESFTCEEVVK